MKAHRRLFSLALTAILSGSKSVYEYQEVPEGRSEFTPGGTPVD